MFALIRPVQTDRSRASVGSSIYTERNGLQQVHTGVGLIAEVCAK